MRADCARTWPFAHQLAHLFLQIHSIETLTVSSQVQRKPSIQTMVEMDFPRISRDT